MAGWHTAYEPQALVGMQVPSTLRALWAQRTRWARGQGEILHKHARAIASWRNRRMWLVAVESFASLLWVTALALALVLSVLSQTPSVRSATAWRGASPSRSWPPFSWSSRWRWASRTDHFDLRAFVIAPLYLLLFWILSACAALHSQVAAVIRGPRESSVVWDIPREEELGTAGAAGE